MRVIFWMSVLALATILSVSPANADEGKVSSILYSCNLSFHATGKSLYLGLGYTDVEGKGMISCYDFLTGATQHIPIKIVARGPGAGLGVTGLALSGGAVGVGVSKGPEALLGRYATVRANAAVGVGVGAATAIRLSNGTANIDVSLQAQNGLGAGVDLLWVDLQADGEKRIEAPAVASQPATEAAPAAVAAAPAPVTVVKSVPSKVLYVTENQPVHLVDQNGKVLRVLYLRRSN